MPIVCDRLRNENPEWVTKGYASTEEWECWASNDDGSVNQNGLIDPRTVIDDPGLPGKGQPHAIFPSAIVVGKRVSQVVANWSVIVQVYYRAYGLYHGGPRPQVSARGDEVPLDLPVWRKLPYSSDINSGALTYYYARADPKCWWTRLTMYRTETKYLTGDAVNSISDLIAQNVGCYYFFRGIPYLLSGQTDVAFDGTSRSVVHYRFYTYGTVPEIEVGSAFGNDVLIPELPMLYTYSERQDPNDITRPPIITAVPFITVCPQGGPLLGF